jgi:Prp8 binding protein
VRLSPDGTHLLSAAMDNTVRTWDVRSFVLGDSRASKVYLGAVHNYEKNLLRCAWSSDGSRVSSGSSDWFVYVWDVQSTRILYKLPGHRGSVNEVDFHPTQPIVASVSSDKTIYLGEIEATSY